MLVEPGVIAVLSSLTTGGALLGRCVGPLGGAVRHTSLRATPSGTEGSAVTAPNEPSSQVRRAPSSRTRLRTLALALTVIVGTGLLLWGADWLARLGAQSLLARSVQASTGSSTPPTVRIDGSFFLVQVVRGRYDDVRMDFVDLTNGPLRINTLRAALTGVHLPFHDVLVRESNQVVIDRAVGEAFLTFDDLNRYLESTGRSIRLQAAAGGVQITGTVDVLGQTVSASAETEISAQDGLLAVAPTRLRTDTPLDGASQLLLGQRFTVLVPLDPLPFGQQITDVAVQETGVVVRTQGIGVVIAP